MKKILTLAFIATISLNAFSQFNQENVKEIVNEEFTSTDATYRLYPTKNIWTFLKLNTRNGQMWQVQFDTEGSSRFVTFLSLESLVTTEHESNGRFTLYPTQNMYNFILLDQVDGRTWQAQWSIEAKDRVIIPIY